MTSRKILVQITKSSTSLKIPNFQNGGKSSWRPISYVGSTFKCLQLIYRCKGNFIRINNFLRTRVQKSTYFQLLIDRKLKGHVLKSCSYFAKNRQDMKK